MEVPSIKEELDRKTVDALSALAHKVAERRMSRGEFGRTAQTLWNVTAGLVDSSISELCAVSAEQATGETMFAAFSSSDTMVLYWWKPDINNFTMVAFSMNGSAPPSRREVKCDFDQRAGVLEKAFNALRARGFVQL